MDALTVMEQHQQQLGFSNEPQPIAGESSSHDVGLPPTAEEELSFLIFRMSGPQDSYILQPEVETVRGKKIKKIYFRVNEIAAGKWRIVKQSTPTVEAPSFPVVEVSNPPRFKSNLFPEVPFKDRLKGWRVESKYTDRADKSYIHSGKKFRSLVEVSAYILYSSTNNLVPDDTFSSLPDIEILSRNMPGYVQHAPVEALPANLDNMFEDLGKIKDFNYYWPRTAPLQDDV